ncbi:MAG TPA: VIT1/CCC1 transporter family protein [Verrucomicrobiae bacterium]|jgi:vacuolar iron transporter family protein|nr:VIT1/CCC1 transporter family protein [Verrucomicrobiae bacterium]
MPQTAHIERHFTAGEVVRDVVIGMSDGLTVPFALAAGLSGAVDNSHIVVVAGLAEIAAGSIAMGLGGYLAAKSDAEHYASEREREVREVEEIPEEEAREVQKVFADYGLSPEESVPVIQALTRKPKEWVDFMMRFELGLEEPDPKRAHRSAATIAASYIAGGIIPLSPYMVLHSVRMALGWSVVVTLIALGVFGYIKGRFTGSRALRSALQTVVIGGLAAGAAFLLAKLIS